MFRNGRRVLNMQKTRKKPSQSQKPCKYSVKPIAMFKMSYKRLMKLKKEEHTHAHTHME